MVVVAQLVRAPDCGSGGRRFEPGLPPFLNSVGNYGVFFCRPLLPKGFFGIQDLKLKIQKFKI